MPQFRRYPALVAVLLPTAEALSHSCSPPPIVCSPTITARINSSCDSSPSGGRFFYLNFLGPSLLSLRHHGPLRPPLTTPTHQHLRLLRLSFRHLRHIPPPSAQPSPPAPLFHPSAQPFPACNTPASTWPSPSAFARTALALAASTPSPPSPTPPVGTALDVAHTPAKLRLELHPYRLCRRTKPRARLCRRAPLQLPWTPSYPLGTLHRHNSLPAFVDRTLPHQHLAPPGGPVPLAQPSWASST